MPRRSAILWRSRTLTVAPICTSSGFMTRLLRLGGTIEASSGWENELLSGVYLGVREVIGAGRDDLLDLIFGGLQGRMPQHQMLPDHGAKRRVVFRLQMLATMA